MSKSKKSKSPQAGPEGPTAPVAVPAVPEQGNTIPALKPSRFVENPAKRWCFTVFDYTESMVSSMCSKCSSENVKYCFGREICPDTKKPHLQCFIEFPKKMRWRTVFKDILPDSVHRAPCRGSFMENYEYCSKDGKFNSNIKMLPVKRHLQVPRAELRPWQQEVLNRIEFCGSNDRTILWINDKDGNNGKSFLARWLVNEYNALMTQGSKRHVLAAAYNNRETRLYIFDVPRVVGNNVSYETIENLRNGLFFSGFGDATGMVNLGFSPIVVVFANDYPDPRKLSLDRWEIYDIYNNCLLPVDYDDIDY